MVIISICKGGKKMPKAKLTALKGTGMRITNQRALVMEIIRQRKGHLDADGIFLEARKKEPRISLSTVYRALQMFKKLGLVEELHLDDTHHFYEVKPSAEHHHLVCLDCGRVIEFQYPLARYINRNIPEAKDFDITETEVRMTGYCSQCRQKRK